jgi:hypothetical protein
MIAVFESCISIIILAATPIIASMAGSPELARVLNCSGICKHDNSNMVRVGRHRPPWFERSRDGRAP